MKRKDFASLITEAIDALLTHIRDAIEDVVIVIEKRPGRRCRRRASSKREMLLLGLYEGVPLTAWGRDASRKFPDKITIFQEPIEWFADSPADIPRVVSETAWHEIGHHFGLSEERVRRLEKRWAAQPALTKKVKK